MRLTFAGFGFDSDTREVFRDDAAVAISPKAFDLLELLIRNRPRALSKEEIHERLWPKTFVSDASLSNLVAELRSVFADDARRPRVLRTVQRFGYAFIADASASRKEPRRDPAFRLVWETREIGLPPGESLFGRDDDAAVWIDDAGVSRRHARIVVEAGCATLEDLGSKNGTFRNGSRVSRPVRLADGDRIQVGRATLIFRELSQVRSTQTERSGKASPVSSLRSARRK